MREDVKRPVGRPRTVEIASKRQLSNSDPWDAAISRRVQQILDALEAPPIDKATRAMFCHWISRSRKFPEIFKNEPYGAEEKLILSCRAIVESQNNQDALIAPIVSAVSLCLRQQWVSRGVAWIEAFDQIPLVATLETLVELFGEKAAVQHFPGVLKRKLWQAFGPDVVVGAKSAKPAPKPPAALTRVAGVEQNVHLELDLLKLRLATASNREYGRQVRQQFDVDEKLACQALQVAKTYGGRPEIFSRLSWIALVALASPALSAAAREALERRIIAGECIGVPAIRAARGALKGGRSRRQASRPAQRMAA